MNPQDEIRKLRQEIIEMRNELNEKIASHTHDGGMATRINLDDVFGLIDTVSSVPTHRPNDFFDQMKIYSSGGTFRLYIYDASGNVWKYTTLS